MTALIIGIVIGLISGLLVYRNNVARSKDIEMKARAELAADKAKAKSILDYLKNR
jgi:hypothetical protein